MNRLEEMNLAYAFVCANSVEVTNPHLNKKLPHIEQLFCCGCFANYRVWVNGNTPIADLEMKDVFCPNCGTPAKDCYSISGHSAGCFNATVLCNLTQRAADEWYAPPK